MTIKEVTSENKHKYLQQIADLEVKVLQAMEEQGKEGQLFITGKEDIEKYIDSENDTIMIAIDEEDKVKSATYITQGQSPFSYNDITKYFKYGNKYKEYIKSKYEPMEYKKVMLKAYETKIQAYQYAKQKIEKEYPQYIIEGKFNIEKFLKDEIKENEFHEKSELREKLNIYMSEYIDNLANSEKSQDIKTQYEQFYWTTIKDIEEEFDKIIDVHGIRNNGIKEWENINNAEIEHLHILKEGALKIYSKTDFEDEKYYTANTNNAIEIDTYITDPNSRHNGIARALIYEGLKKQMEKHLIQEDKEELFLCSTLHKNNASSKYVSEFFGLKDNLYVNRRQGRDREVHICRIKKQEASKFLDEMYNKLAVLYGYNPNNKKISNEEKSKILKEQIKYERSEIDRLHRIKKLKGEKFVGKIASIESKKEKLEHLKSQLCQIEGERDNEKER